MTNRFGYQFVVMIGGLLICSGTIATSFASSINQIYITYGFVAGNNLASSAKFSNLLTFFEIVCHQLCRLRLLSDLLAHGNHPL